MKKTAILIDGGFYKKRAFVIYGKQSPEEQVDKLINHCYKHLRHKGNRMDLYRIFYYDCPPLDKKAVHPLTGEEIDFKTQESYKENMEFLDLLKHRRKVALRLGKLSGNGSDFILPAYNVRKICNGTLTFNKLKPSDLKLIDFILDPMWNQISPDLLEHIDGLFSKCDKPKNLL